MAFLELYAAGQDPDLQVRVGVALMQTANNVANNASSTQVEVAMIGTVLASVPTYVQLFTEYACQTQGISSASTDAQILAAVAAGWTAFAGKL